MSSKPLSSDPRIRRTRQMLFEALLALIKERGFETLSVTDITRRAGLNRATFYLHYQDKYDLLSQSVQELLGEMQALVKLPPLSQPPRLEDGPPAALLLWVEQIAHYADFYQILLTSNGMISFTKELRSYFEDFVLESFRQVVTSEADKLLLAARSRFIAAAYLGVIEWWLENKQPVSPQQLAGWLWQLSLDGSIGQRLPNGR